MTTPDNLIPALTASIALVERRKAEHPPTPAQEAIQVLELAEQVREPLRDLLRKVSELEKSCSPLVSYSDLRELREASNRLEQWGIRFGRDALRTVREEGT